MACRKHEWVGSADGVTCVHCGKKLTHEEYVKTISKRQKPANSGLQ